MCGVSPGTVVGLSEPDEGVAQGNARQGCVACELDRLRGRPEADFGADGPDRRIGVECLREVMQRVVPDLRVVVEQQEAVARGGPDAEVVAAGEAEVLRTSYGYYFRIAFLQFRRFVALRSVVDDYDFERRRDVAAQRVDHRRGEREAVVVDRI